ncbi:IS5 family transposase [Roseospira marina]|uniref:IS5 family transposase n=1 Tax=Roseospira marina TaxID=140057 RepID=UPI0035D4FF0B
MEPHLPRNRPGARRVDDRRVLSGIIHVLKTGCRWQDCPATYGPPTTIYNRFRRWSGRGIWQQLFEALVAVTPDDMHMIDSTSTKAHRSAAGGKGGRPAQAIGRSRGGRTTKIHAVVDGRGRPIAFEITAGQLGDVRAATALLGPLPPGRWCAADTAYDSNGLRQFLIERGTLPVIPNNPTRKRRHPFDPKAYRHRNLIERMFCRLKDFRRIATRYDKLAVTFTAAVAIAAIVTWWI